MSRSTAPALMRILIEALAADFGGIRTYVENLLRAWAATHPEDELLVVVRAGSDLEVAGHPTRVLRVPRPAIVGRPLAQTLTARRLARDFEADVVLATMPASGLRHPGVPFAVVVHDLRHEVRPEQFTKGRRLVRGISYRRTYALADAFVSVSHRTLDDLHRLHPTTRAVPAVVAHHGADHVLDWPGRRGAGPAVSFAHHTNKNPELVLEAWAAGRRRGLTMPDLVVLGTGAGRVALQQRARALGVADVVRMAPYLPEEEFHRTMAEASLVVFPSDFEGFGLPVVEGMLLGVPVVIGPEPATLEIAGGHAAVLDDWTPDALARAVGEAMGFDGDHLERARAHAAELTWARCVEQTRGLLADLAG